MSSTTINTNDLVLVSGATGFVGTAVTLAYLRKGFRVRATARSLAKGEEWEKKHPGFGKQLEWAVVKDIATPGAFNEAIKGVTIVAHTASPFHFTIEDPEKDMLIPALNGTLEILKSAASEPSVKRVVITSSFAGVLDLNNVPGVGTTYTEKDWNPATYEQAKNSDNPGFIYCASKGLAEAAAWDFVKKENVSFSLTTLAPPMIFGPPEQVLGSIKDINTSSGAVWALVDAEKVNDPGFPVFVDVRDMATLHVLATTEEIAKGKRYLTVAAHYHDSQIAEILRRNFPEQAHRIPDVPATAGADHFKTDSSLVEKELGWKWTSLEKSVVDTAKVLFELKKQNKA